MKNKFVDNKILLNVLQQIMIFLLAGTLLKTYPAEIIANGNNNAKVANVHFSIVNNNVIINYDLLGKPGNKYNVSLYLKRASDTGYVYTPQMVTGDIGRNQVAGLNKRIVWKIGDEIHGGLTGNDFYFEVNAVAQKESKSFLSWIGIGAAALAATVTYFIISHNYNKGRSPAGSLSTYPLPPGRP